MNKKTQLSIGGLLLALLAAFFGPQFVGDGPAQDAAHAQSAPAVDGARESASSTATKTPAPAAGSKSSSKAAEKPRAGTQATDSLVEHAEIGFRSRSAFDEHFQKHGAEFGAITQQEYLRLAQALRDRAVGGDVLEIVRDDGVASRFDKRSGAFVAFNKDLSLRTFFKPNDGVRYFERQAEKDH